MELTSGLHGYLRLDPGAPALAFDRGDAAQAEFVREATRYYQVFDAGSGRLLAQSDAFEPLGLHFTPQEVRAFRDQPRFEDFSTNFGRIRIANSVISTPAGRTYLLQVGASLDAMDRALDRFLALLLVSVPAGLVAAFATGRWMARVALAPLSRLASAARNIDIAGVEQRLPVRGAGDELDDVAVAFNGTLTRLEQAIGEMRQFSAALAHELRTPLAALRGEIEMAMRERGADTQVTRRLASQLEEIDKLSRLIDRLLTLARAEAGEIAIARERVDLGALGTSLVDQLDLVAQARRVALRCELAGPVIVRGDERWLERLLLNLVDNAIKFTPEGGEVVLRISHDEGAAIVEVTDTGIGIPADVVPHIFERFFRVDPARSPASEGVGLGLSLAKWIVDGHNGHIDVESQPGRGSTFRVRLPLER
jgi:heavy metal sensor kinase